MTKEQLAEAEEQLKERLRILGLVKKAANGDEDEGDDEMLVPPFGGDDDDDDADAGDDDREEGRALRSFSSFGLEVEREQEEEDYVKLVMGNLSSFFEPHYSGYIT